MPIELSDNDDVPDFNVMTVKKEVFQYYSEGRLESFSDSNEMDLASWDDFSEVGHRMHVSMVRSSFIR